MRVFVPFVFAVTSLPLFAQAPQSTPAKSKPAAAKTPSAKSPAAAPSSAPAKSTPAKPAAGTPGQTSVTSTASGPAAATRDASKAVITVGNESISAKEFESFIETLPPQYRAQAQGPMKKQIAEQFVRVKLLAAEARRQGLDKDPATQAKIAFNAENILAGIAFNDILKKARVDEAQLKKYYDEHKGSYEEAQARHILIRFKGSQVPLRSGQKELSEEEALAKATDLRKQILAGADFAELAKKESDDAGSGANGGDLGSFARGSMVPAFDAAAFSQPVGQVSEPLKTQFGYHIIKVEKRDSKTFADVKADIEEKMKPDTARDAVEALARSASISYDPAYFGASEPKTPAMTPLSPAPSKTPAAAPQSQPSKPTEPVKP